jgi:LacI family transcriptional regulator
MVAKRAGVSTMTVSRALRGNADTKPATRVWLCELAEQMGYRPDAKMNELMAQVRKRRLTDLAETIVILKGHNSINPDPEWWPTVKISVDAAKVRAASLGYRLQVEQFPFDGARDIPIRRSLRARGVRGLIVIPPVGENFELSFNFEGFSAVILGNVVKFPSLHRVAGNERHALQLCLREVTKRGYRRVGLVMHTKADEWTDHAWLSAFLPFQFLLPEEQRVPICIYSDWDQARNLVETWAKKEKPDCVIATDVFVLPWIKSAGYIIPQEIGFACCALGRPDEDTTISGTNHRFESIGVQLVNRVFAQLSRGESGVPVDIVDSFVETSWHEGRTLRAPALGSNHSIR